MKLRNSALVMLSLVGVAGFGSFAVASLCHPSLNVAAVRADGDDEEMEIKLADMPAAARAAVTKVTAESSVKKVTKSSDDGMTTYEIDYTDGNVVCAMVVSSAGDVMETERAVAQEKMPAAAMAALVKHYPGAKFSESLLVTTISYEVTVTVNGKSHEVVVNAAGNVADGFEEAGADESKEVAKEDAKTDVKKDTKTDVKKDGKN